MEKRLAVALMLGTCTAAGLLQYGCSDDDSKTVTPGKADASETKDSSSPIDSSINDATSSPTTYKARATIAPTGLADAGSPTGTVDFVETDGSVAIKVQISGATPGEHGMHIHVNGSCESTDAGAAAAAGGHWNPADAGHGFPTSTSHHPGDFGNITISPAGTGTLNLESTSFTVNGTGPNSAINHAIVFHQGTDDGMTQPTGNSGGRAGCGVVQQQ